MTEQEKMENRVKNRTCELERVYRCTDCGAEVKTTLPILLYAHDNGLRVTTRCEACRAKKNARFSQN